MKKYSAEFFKKKFGILFNKLIIKDGLINEVKETRKKLGIPVENGFLNSLEFAGFLFKKLTKSEKDKVFIWGIIEQYEIENHVRVSKKDKDEFFDYLTKKSKQKDDSIVGTLLIQGIIENHHSPLTNDAPLRTTKFFSKLSPIVSDIFNKYWGFDLLDEQVAIHFVEKFLFLGKNGVDEYIQNRINCPACRYIGIDHFSPSRHDMKDGDKGMRGTIGKDYVFNQQTVRRLSAHFNSVFLLLKPYTTKEQVLNYIEDNWHWLKEHMIEKNAFYKQEGVHPSKIKESDFDKNQLIYSMYKLSKKDLVDQYKEQEFDSLPPTYKEGIIAKILEKKYNIGMTSDAIKKSATRFAKSTKLKKEPRDIRDI